MVQENLKGKTKPAGEKDEFRVTYTSCASNEKKTELKTGKGQDFDNDILLEMLGFKNKNGEMTVDATTNDVVREEKNGKVIKRTANGRTLTGEEEQERD